MNSNTKPGNDSKPGADKKPHDMAGPKPTPELSKTTPKTGMHDGKVVSVSGNTLVSTCHEGKQHSHTVSMDAKVTCDGAVCKTEDLKPGARIRITTKPEDQHTATKIESLQRHHEFAKV